MNRLRMVPEAFGFLAKATIACRASDEETPFRLTCCFMSSASLRFFIEGLVGDTIIGTRGRTGSDANGLGRIAMIALLLLASFSSSDAWVCANDSDHIMDGDSYQSRVLDLAVTKKRKTAVIRNSKVRLSTSVDKGL